MPEPSQQDDSSVLARLYTAMMAAYLAWILWHLLLPPDRRKTVHMRLLRSSARVTSLLARRAAAASIQRELATGVEQYSVPYRLALLRDRLDAAYEDVRHGYA